MRKLEAIDMKRLSVEEYRHAQKTRLTVVLDNVRSLHNVGSILRTADAFRIEKIIMCGVTGTPPHPELHKTALGAEDSVSWEYASDTLQVVRNLRQQGYRVYAIEQCEGSTLLNNFHTDTHQPIAIILGNEVHGVEQTVVDACDGCIEIPQYGTKHSLNVSVTAGMVIWELARRLLPTLILSVTFCAATQAQTELIDATPIETDSLYSVMPTWHIRRQPELYDGELIPVIILPEIPIYPLIHFRNRRHKQKYDRMVLNVKKVLPIAKQARAMLIETYQVLETLPPGERQKHLSRVEKDIKRQYTPVMKKLTFSQGKLLIKLIDRECNQSSYKIIQAFLGSGRAVFYQVFAWTLGASLKKTYDPDGDDAMIERIVREVEVGAI